MKGIISYLLLKNYKVLFADFQEINHFKFALISSDYNRTATITTPFLKDIVNRFSRYYSRQGQPNLNLEKIFQELRNKQ